MNGIAMDQFVRESIQRVDARCPAWKARPCPAAFRWRLCGSCRSLSRGVR